MIVAAVIVTYNPKLSDLVILINNIIDSVEQVVFIDNGSNNIAAIETFAVQYSKIKLMQLGENKGIGFAQNRGIEYALADKEITGIILFDHDSHPEPDMISTLTNAYHNFEADNIKVGALGPIFIDPRTKNNYPISVFKGFRLIKNYPVEGNNNPIPASFLIASGSFIPRTTLEKVGLMKEDFFIDYIDIEWSFRAASKGYPSFAIPNAKMYHQVGDDRMKVLGREISVHTPLRRYYLARNSVLMLKTKYINWQYKIRETYFSITRVIVYLFMVKNRRTYLKYILRGWRDGLINKTGRADFV